MVDSTLQKSILETLALFAAQDQALTLLEIHDSLLQTQPEQKPVDLLILQAALDGIPADRLLRQNGLYTLAGREALFEKRHETYINTMLLFRRAGRYGSVLRHLPFVRAAAISGSTAQMNASVNSDIDLFIITAPGRIFLARFLVSAYFQVLGMRRHDRKIRARFCLNHYVAGALKMPQDRNAYTAMLYTSLLSIFGHEYVKTFWQENLDWIKEFIVSPALPDSHVFKHAHSPQSRLQKLLEAALFPVAGLLERLSTYLQKRRIRQSEFVIVSQDQLSFHPDSKGQRILGRYREISGGFTIVDNTSYPR